MVYFKAPGALWFDRVQIAASPEWDVHVYMYDNLTNRIKNQSAEQHYQA